MTATCPQHGKMSPNPRERIKCLDVFVFSSESHVHKMLPYISHNIWHFFVVLRKRISQQNSSKNNTVTMFEFTLANSEFENSLSILIPNKKLMRCQQKDMQHKCKKASQCNSLLLLPLWAPLFPAIISYREKFMYFLLHIWTLLALQIISIFFNIFNYF